MAAEWARTLPLSPSVSYDCARAGSTSSLASPAHPRPNLARDPLKQGARPLLHLPQQSLLILCSPSPTSDARAGTHDLQLYPLPVKLNRSDLHTCSTLVDVPNGGWLGQGGFGRTLKSIPIVVMKLGVQLSSQNRRRRHDLPTPSTSRWALRKVSATGRETRQSDREVTAAAG
jgi:hypothetical protein